MTKKNKEYIKQWSEGIDNIFKEQSRKDKMTVPSLSRLGLISDYARGIDNRMQLMINTAQMAHEGIIDLNKSQEILDAQKEKVIKDIEELLVEIKKEN